MLTRQLQHFYARLEMRWATRYPRYRQFLLREITRLETLIPLSRPAEIPVEEWLPPHACARVLRVGPRVLQAPPDVPPDMAAEFEEVRASIQASVSAQEQVAVAHYLRLVREGRLPAEEEDLQLLAGLSEAERDEVEEERALELDAEEAAEKEEVRAWREVALGEMSAPPAVWDSLTAVGYNGTEAIGVLRWVETMDAAARDGRYVYIYTYIRLNLPAVRERESE